jgi:hypothetical protein
VRGGAVRKLDLESQIFSGTKQENQIQFIQTNHWKSVKSQTNHIHALELHDVPTGPATRRGLSSSPISMVDISSQRRDGKKLVEL